MVKATFIKSAVWPKDYPHSSSSQGTPFPELAVAGRSNVGKSSLINALTQQRHLAKVSGTPGRTQVLNFFLINEHFVLCDLPGFGYAKVPLEMKRQWGEMMERYFTTREPLRALLLLMDSRRDPGDWERSLAEMGSRVGWGIIPVVTKIDKLSRSERKPALERIARGIGVEARQVIGCSASSREGLEQVWAALERFAGPRPGTLLLPPPPLAAPAPPPLFAPPEGG